MKLCLEIENLRITIGGVEIRCSAGVDGETQSDMCEELRPLNGATFCPGCGGRIDVGDECVMLGQKAYCPMCACARPGGG